MLKILKIVALGVIIALVILQGIKTLNRHGALADDPEVANISYKNVPASTWRSKGCRISFDVTPRLSGSVNSVRIKVAILDHKGVLMENLRGMEIYDPTANKTEHKSPTWYGRDCKLIGNIEIDADTVFRKQWDLLGLLEGR